MLNLMAIPKVRHQKITLIEWATDLTVTANNRPYQRSRQSHQKLYWDHFKCIGKNKRL